MYVPVMKNRTVEVGVLQQLSAIGVFDDNVIPLIELVQKKTRNNNKNTFIQDLTKILSDAQNMRIMVVSTNQRNCVLQRMRFESI